MSVWVNVWRWTTKTARAGSMFVIVASTHGCIDDFDDPKGYGGSGTGGSSGSSRGACFEVCERAASCQNELECKRACASLATEAEAAGCLEEYGELMECAMELDDICASLDACGPPAERLGLCVM